MIVADIVAEILSRKDKDREAQEKDREAQRAAKVFIETYGPESFVTVWVAVLGFVYSEFMGIIKGSERSFRVPVDSSTRRHTVVLPSRSNPTFVTQRKTIYALFEAYCKLKMQRRQHDVADRTHAILKTLLGETSLKWSAGRLPLIDALAAEVNYVAIQEGLFWAGDTAQTISAGSSFHFDDLKAFLYRIEEDQSMTIIQDRNVTQPTSFQLAINHRSHGGIVNCAHAVIELITRFWPNSIDGLQPEHGIVDGLKPVFFHGWDKDTVRYEQFLFGASGSRIELGAQQCILVRDQAAKEKLRQQVGNVGMIMTLYESKGLEFNDVLLYQLLRGLSVDLSRWRVVLGAMNGRYAGVCSELKQLYVGITRARKNMWIVDKSEKCEPMRMFWTSRAQVQNCTPGIDVPHLAVSSTPEEWEDFGRSLFQHKRYTQAIHCFERASLPHEVKVSGAYYLRELARDSVGIASPVKQQDAFRTAAKAFIDCGANPYHQTRERLQYYHNAADCYIRAGDDSLATDA
ncbi:P-loop containing nucleoside triphosphate hydrolase protein, partial [Melanogaster broomeanus]